MAERLAKPTWVRSFHPADTEKNLEMLAAFTEVLLPDVPVLTKDLPATVEVVAGENQTFDLTVTAVARGTLTYLWQMDPDGEGYDNVSGGTNVDLTVSTWSDATHAGTYRCKITNTLNGVTATVYSNECVATTAE